MDVKKLLAKIKDMNPEDQAKAVSAFMSENKRRKTVEEARRDVRIQCFANCKKLTKSQQEAYIYEFLAENHNYFNEKWLRKNHPDLFSSKE